jgi:AcrR family transcriptional regulator
VTRAYRSAVRQEQAARTRARILEAFVDELARGHDDFVVADVAARAGVSVRTVYQHFPNREAQIDAVVAWIDAQVGAEELPATAAELPAFTRRRYDTFFAHERVFRAQLGAGVATEVRRRRRRKLEAAVDGCLAATGAPAAEARAAAAMIKELIGAPLGLRLMDHGLDREETTSVAEWTVQLIVAALEKHARRT